MFKQFFVLLCLIILTIACQPTETPELTQAQRLEIADSVRQKNQEMMEIAALSNEESFNKGMAYWVESSDELWMGNPGIFVNRTEIIPTKEGIIEDYKPMIGTRARTNYTIGNEYFAVLSADHVVHVYEAKYSITDLEGETGPEYPMTATAVWVKRDGDWKILHYHQSWRTDIEETEAEEKTENY